MSIGKTELVDIIATETGVSKSTVSGVFTALFEAIKDEVNNKGNAITIVGFGRFTKKTKEGVVTHMKTGKKLAYSTSRIAFKCSPTLKK